MSTNPPTAIETDNDTFKETGLTFGRVAVPVPNPNQKPKKNKLGEFSILFSTCLRLNVYLY
jgi:hypothetical protein